MGVKSTVAKSYCAGTTQGIAFWNHMERLRWCFLRSCSCQRQPHRFGLDAWFSRVRARVRVRVRG